MDLASPPARISLNVVVQELKQEGFGIITGIDFQGIATEKLHIDEPRYRILGASNPNLAHQAMRADPDIGLLLPCNVVLRENKDGEVTVAFTPPETLMALPNSRDISNLATEVRRRLEGVRDQVVIRTERAA